MGIIIKSGSLSFLGKFIITLIKEILDYGLLTESLTEGSEDYLLVSQAVTDTDDFGLIV